MQSIVEVPLRYVVSFVFSLIFIAQAQALTISGVTLPETIHLDKQNLVLNGAGIREKYFIDLYVGSLYLPHKASNQQAAMEQGLLVIRLNVTSSLITAEKMQDAINEGFDTVTNGNVQSILPEINQFMNLFNEKIHKGDQFSFEFTPNGLSCYKNGSLLSTIENAHFSNALMAIWLGDDPVQQSLKRAMLGDL